MPNKKIDMDGNNYCPIKDNNKNIIQENKESFDKNSNNINYNISNQDNKASMKIPKKVDSDKSNFNNSINEVKKKKIERIPKSNSPINFINKNDSILTNNYYKFKYNEIINNKYKVSI